MAQTVVGFFEEAAAAQQAMQQLERIGIARQQVDVRTGVATEARNAASERSPKSDTQSANGMKRFINSLFGNDSVEAGRYSKIGASGCYMVSVHVQSRAQAESVTALLDECGALAIEDRALQADATPIQNDSVQSEHSINQERASSIPGAQVDREETAVELGNERVQNRIIDLPANQQVQVERQSVNRPVTDVELRLFQEGDIELTEYTEVPVVNKEAWVVEEIKLRKEVSERGETIHDSVRHTEVDIDHTSRNTTHPKMSDG